MSSVESSSRRKWHVSLSAATYSISCINLSGIPILARNCNSLCLFFDCLILWDIRSYATLSNSHGTLLAWLSSQFASKMTHHCTALHCTAWYCMYCEPFSNLHSFSALICFNLSESIFLKNYHHNLTVEAADESASPLPFSPSLLLNLTLLFS